MKNRMFVCLICTICAMFLTGIIYANEKSDVKVELVYENFTQEVGLDKVKVLSIDQRDIWLFEKIINDFDGTETIKRSYLKFSKSLFKEVTLYGIIGMSQNTSKIDKPLQFTNLSSTKDFEWATKQKGLSVDSQGELGFLTGVGIAFNFRTENNIGVGLNFQYVIEKSRKHDINLLDSSHDGYNFDHHYYYEWQTKIVTKKSRNEEFVGSIYLSKKMGGLTFLVGSSFVLAKTSYRGKSETTNSQVHFSSKTKHEDIRENEFLFKSRSGEGLSTFMEARWKLNKKEEMFAKLIVGARNGIQLGVTF